MRTLLPVHAELTLEGGPLTSSHNDPAAQYQAAQYQASFGGYLRFGGFRRTRNPRLLEPHSPQRDR